MAINNKENIRIQSIIPRTIKEDADILARLNGRSLSNWVAELIKKEIKNNLECIELEKKKDTE